MKRLIGLSAILFSMAFSQGVVTQLDKGSINYSDQSIAAIGIGFVPQNAINAGQARRMALRIAKQDALRQLIEIVNGVTLTSETTMSGAMVDDVINTKVQGFIRGARQVGAPKYLSDTSVEVEYSVPMSGISDIVLPPVTVPAAPPGTPAGAATTPTAGGITGVIIDARGLKARPAMAPRILDQNGNAVYGPGTYSREYAVTNGVAGYSKSIEAAQKDPRVLGNPLVVKGVSTSGTNRTDVVISNADVSKIDAANRSYNVLKDCRVLILLD
ncbi:MAG: hypothetical protein QF842_00765 [Candidatus Marinimicrobia bacterium]|jgi:hypothetical protein|nr:hypothetical protein [Candidatus Neomarinimicrobiota bacterium]|tara:strand:- start:327 stop:1139 length:813 start_codon:yes stop_codon:yes gene_type:complete